MECQTVLVTHSRDEAFLLCSRLAAMDRGTISAAGGVKELFDRPKTVAAARLTGVQKYRGRQKNGRFYGGGARLGHLPYCLQSHPGRTPGSGRPGSFL